MADVKQRTWTQYSALSILAQFKDVKLQRNDVKSAIRRHLLQFRGKKAENSVNQPNKCIDKVCERACKLLLSQRFDIWDTASILKENEYPFQFKPEWLSHVSILLPNDDEVIEILPYLLACYLENANTNRLDPFAGEKSSGWMDIFQEYSDEQQNELGAGNRSRSIIKLADNFTDFPKVKFSVLNDEPAYEIIDIVKNRSKARIHVWEEHVPIYIPRRDLNSTTWRKVLAQSKEYAKAWERYRRFAAFCEACESIKSVNITASMAHFAGSWDFDPEIYAYRLPPKAISEDMMREEILRLMKQESDPCVYLCAFEAKYRYACCKAKKLPYDGIL